MVQHTVQVEKSLEWIGRGPTEARRLIRVLYRDLAPVEMLGSTQFGEKEREAVAAALSERAAEVGAEAGAGVEVGGGVEVVDALGFLSSMNISSVTQE